MKKEFSICPDTIDEHELYGFAWEEFVTAVPTPLVVVSTYKPNGKTNATMQSWVTFVSDKDGFYCIFGSVHKKKHMYESIQHTKYLVVNFPSAVNFMKCMDTIQNNGYDDDEIALSALTSERATKVNAPRIKECFLK